MMGARDSSRRHMGVDHARRQFMATLEIIDEGSSEPFEAPAHCDLWPVQSPTFLLIDGDPYVGVLWSVTPEPLPTPVSRARQRHEQAAAILETRSAKRKAKRKPKPKR